MNENIGINRIKFLMRSGVIPAVIEGKKLLTEKRFVDAYINGLFNEKSPKRTDIFNSKIKGLINGIR